MRALLWSKYQRCLFLILNGKEVYGAGFIVFVEKKKGGQTVQSLLGNGTGWATGYAAVRQGCRKPGVVLFGFMRLFPCNRLMMKDVQQVVSPRFPNTNTRLFPVHLPTYSGPTPGKKHAAFRSQRQRPFHIHADFYS